jgi:hypothetical protein
MASDDIRPIVDWLVDGARSTMHAHAGFAAQQTVFGASDEANVTVSNTRRERRFSSALDCRSTDPNSRVAVAAGIPLPAAIVAVIVAVGVDGAAVEGKATKTAVEAPVVKAAAAMEGECTSRTVPTDGESTAAESASTDSATHSVCAHTATMRGHGNAVSATAMSAAAVSTAAVSTTTVSAATTRRRNSRGKGDRCTDRGGGGNGYEALSEHDSASLVPSPCSRS